MGLFRLYSIFSHRVWDRFSFPGFADAAGRWWKPQGHSSSSYSLQRFGRLYFYALMCVHARVHVRVVLNRGWDKQLQFAQSRDRPLTHNAYCIMFCCFWNLLRFKFFKMFLVVCVLVPARRYAEKFVKQQSAAFQQWGIMADWWVA